MKKLTVGNLKTHFSEVLDNIKNGEEYIVEYGKKHHKIAAIIPYSKYKKTNKLKLGVLKNENNIEFSSNFKITTNDFLGL